MADYPTECSIAFECSPEEAWFIRHASQFFECEDDLEYTPLKPLAALCPTLKDFQQRYDVDYICAPIIEYEPQDRTLYMFDGDGCAEPWRWGLVIHDALDWSEEGRCVEISYANTCTKPRPGAFGGGIWRVNKDGVHLLTDPRYYDALVEIGDMWGSGKTPDLDIIHDILMRVLD